MGSFANSLFKFMLGWVQGAVSAVWSAFTNENGDSLFSWIGKHWIMLALILCVIGLAADLCVYIFRWKPFKVWKSFFSRDREDTDASPEPEKAERPGQASRPVQRPAHQVQASVPRTEYSQEPDLTQWETKTEQVTQEETETAAVPDMITNAGYIVPADSPYRRPADQNSAAGIREQEDRIITDRTERPEPAPVVTGRRRRLKVSELFTDPEEELRQFDAPQHVIDSRKAYRDPVYPRGWKKSEEEGE